MLYFAYGSNTNLPALRRYLVQHGLNFRDVSKPCRALLEGWRIRTNYLMSRMTGAANIEPTKGTRVEGLLMEMTPAVHQALRRKEGWPHRYREIAVTVTIPRTRQIMAAITYVVSKAYQLPVDMPVHEDYRDAVLDGAKQAGFTKKYQHYLSRLLRTA